MIDLIWIVGPPGSGKSTFIDFFKKLLKKPREINVLRDFDFYLKLKREDVNHLHHQHFGNKEGFLITDSFIPNRAIKLTTAKALKLKGLKLIEVGRGLDSQGKVDFTFKKLVSLLSLNTLSRSIFIYIWAPFEKRLRRNKVRLGNEKVTKRKVNPTAMQRFFKKDDFKLSKKLLPQPIFIVNNTAGLLSLKFRAWQISKKVNKLVDEKTENEVIDKEITTYVINKAKKNRAPFPCWDVYALVLDKNRIIVGEASRKIDSCKRFVLEHAERALLERLTDENLRATTLYTSLEPCTYSNQKQGCVFLIRNKKIKRVVIGSPDFSPVNSYRSVKLLKDKGIQVIFSHQINELLGLKARLISPEDWILNTISSFKRGRNDHWSKAREDKYFNMSWPRSLLFNLCVFLTGRLPFWERKILSERLGD